MRHISLIWFVLLLAAIVIAGWSWPSQAQMSDDLDLLLEASEAYYTDIPSIQIKYGTFLKKAYSNDTELANLATSFNQRLGLSSDHENIEIVQGTSVYTIKASNQSIQSSLKLSALNKDEMYISLQLSCECESPEALKQFKSYRNQVEIHLKKLELNSERNTILQGTSTLSDNTIDTFWSTLETTLDAELVEAYEGHGTFSHSLYSSKLEQEIYSGINPMNVQAALHQNTVTGDWRLTLGTPIITIEY
jgi:hypothetical protein